MSKVHRSFKMRLRSTVLAFSGLLGVFSIVTLFNTELPRNALITTAVDFEITRQVAEAEELPVTPVLVGVWTVATTSATSTSSSINTEPPIMRSIVQTKNAASAEARPSPLKPTLTKAVPAKVSSPVSDSFNLATVGRQIHSKSNSARSAKNLPALGHDSTLAAIAQKRSDDMAKRGYFSHVSPGGCDLACRVSGLGYLSYGENLGEYTEYAVFTETALAARFIEMWLSSPSHRKNLMSSAYTDEGIGVAVKGDRVVVTVLFGAK